MTVIRNIWEPINKQGYELYGTKPYNLKGTRILTYNLHALHTQLLSLSLILMKYPIHYLNVNHLLAPFLWEPLWAAFKSFQSVNLIFEMR